uniref:Uncharacterized protein n=1 Tax=Amphimedon queenslandica TaxID=400682 RepID=A0A1X7VWB5_AMPQE
ILQRGFLGKVQQYYVKKEYKFVEHLSITSSYGLKKHLLSVSIVLKKSVSSYQTELTVIYQI